MSSEIQFPLLFHFSIFRMWVQNGCYTSRNLHPCSSKEGAEMGWQQLRTSVLPGACWENPLWSFICSVTPIFSAGTRWHGSLGTSPSYQEEGGLCPYTPPSSAFQCFPFPQSLRLSIYLTNIHGVFPRPGPGSLERNKKSFLLLKRSWSNL